MKITLDRLLRSRDERWQLQQQLLAAHRGATLVCLTVVVPGAEKRNRRSLVVARAAVRALREAFGSSLTTILERDLATGYEAFALVSMPPVEAKRVAVGVEECHALGRLFDIDVISPDATPLSRSAVGAQPRRCLMCDREARFCMRNHSHTFEELLGRVNLVVDSYVRAL